MVQNGLPNKETPLTPAKSPYPPLKDLPIPTP